MKKDLAIIVAIVIIIFAGTILFKSHFSSTPVSNDIGVKPMEGTVELKLGETVAIGSLSVTPVSVMEDSRCAQGVECIWAGTVKLRIEITSGLGTANQVLELGKPITTEAEEVTLVNVIPNQIANQTIMPSEYRFIIRVTNRS